MTAKDPILATLATGERVLNAYLNDLGDADLLVRPVPGQNHIAWQLGHLIATESWIVNAIRPGTSPELPAGFADAHGRDEVSTGSDDPARFLTKSRYLELLHAQREATRSVLAGLSDAELDAPGPERVRNMCPTVGATLTLAGTHLLMHLGQFVSVRRKLGKPVTI